MKISHVGYRGRMSVLCLTGEIEKDAYGVNWHEVQQVTGAAVSCDLDARPHLPCAGLVDRGWFCTEDPRRTAPHGAFLCDLCAARIRRSRELGPPSLAMLAILVANLSSDRDANY